MDFAQFLFQPRRSLATGQILAIEVSTNASSKNTDLTMLQPSALLHELGELQHSSLHNIPLSLRPQSINLTWCEALARACEQTAFAKSLIEIVIQESDWHTNSQYPKAIRELGFRTGATIPSDHPWTEPCPTELFDALEIQLNGSEAPSIGAPLIILHGETLTHARSLHIETVARGVETIHQYRLIADSGLFTAGIGSFFWLPQSANSLLRNELSFSRFFTSGWKQHRGRWVPTNPLYFHAMYWPSPDTGHPIQ